jgi:hypothetical protein
VAVVDPHAVILLEALTMPTGGIGARDDMSLKP